MVLISGVTHLFSNLKLTVSQYDEVNQVALKMLFGSDRAVEKSFKGKDIEGKVINTKQYYVVASAMKGVKFIAHIDCSFGNGVVVFLVDPQSVVPFSESIN